MPKAVFRPQELKILSDIVVIEVPVTYPDLSQLTQNEELEEEQAVVEEYSGPTAEELRQEAEDFKAQWEEERKTMIQDAQLLAESLVKKAEEEIAREVDRKNNEAMLIVSRAEQDASKIIADANAKALEIEKEIREALEAQRKETLEQAAEAGREEGFAEGKAEVDRLVERTQTVLERAQNKRADILAETEQEIVDLVLLIARKVIKVISENQRNVIISNVVQALRKIKTKGDVIIRVNIADIKLTTEHKRDFIQLIEGAKSIQVVEDSSVDSGGCIIETDFGEIDARIASQLAELESRILDISPIKSKIRKSNAAAGNAGAAPNGAVNGMAKAAGNSLAALAKGEN